MPQCTAYTAKGNQCTKRSYDGINFCGVHHKACYNSGPHRYALLQLRYKFDGDRNRILETYRTAMETLDGVEYNRMAAERDVRLAAARRVFMTEHADMLTRQREEIARTGVNPDAEADARRAQRRQVQIQRRAQRAEERLAEGQRIENIMGDLDHRIGALRGFLEELDDDDGPAFINVQRVQAQRRLEAFVQDPQNVHTTEAVNQTKEIIAKIRMVEVPEDYRWNMSVTSKTPGEIIAECKLSIHAACQMLTQYSNDVAIYEIEAGIYGKVLDSVWQFVKNSSDKNDLCRILKQEMEDNIGMCAQGNLTRICNIVAGYMDGVGQQESKSEKLGRLFAELAKIEDRVVRENKAKDVLVTNDVPHNEWSAWMEAVMDD